MLSTSPLTMLFKISFPVLSEGDFLKIHTLPMVHLLGLPPLNYLEFLSIEHFLFPEYVRSLAKAQLSARSKLQLVRQSSLNYYLFKVERVSSLRAPEFSCS